MGEGEGEGEGERRLCRKVVHVHILLHVLSTHSESKAELCGSFQCLLKVDAMVQLVLIKLHQQLQELCTL